jgi:integrase
MQTKKKLPPGLIWRGETIHIDTTIGDKQVRKTTKTDDVDEALAVLDDLKYHHKNRILTGKPADLGKTWAEAVNQYLDTTYHKNTKELMRQLRYIRDRAIPLDTPIKNIYNSTLDPIRKELKGKKRKANTFNSYIKVVRQVMNKCVEWEDAGMPWLNERRYFKTEKIKKNPVKHMNQKKGYVLSWEEQDRLLGECPEHLRDAALFGVNTGSRKREITNLRWDWMIYFRDLKVTAFQIPEEFHKPGREKILVLNSIARDIVKKQRGKHPEYVFTYKGNHIEDLHSSAYAKARERAGLKHVTIHDLRHTFATRLGRYGVSKVDIALLLGQAVEGVQATYAFTTKVLEPMIKNCEMVVERKPMTFMKAGEFVDFEEYDEEVKITKTPQGHNFLEAVN